MSSHDVCFIINKSWAKLSLSCLSSKLGYLQHICVRDTIVYHYINGLVQDYIYRHFTQRKGKQNSKQR